MDGNWLFHILNNLIFDGLLSPEDLRNELYDFMIRKKTIIWKFHRKWFWYRYLKYKKKLILGIYLENMTFYDLIRININIFNYLAQIT